ncbi:amidohydrolase family protein [Planosporangium sp. 12N6]|uniref:amidohydrolase family protein n=1 Tax=Planosporangium spinosum TaxID=3402278 RepID=UPI003CEDF93A
MSKVDMHAHLAPVVDPAHLDPVLGIAERDGQLVLDGHAVGPRPLYDAGALCDYLDRAGLDEAAVSVPPPFFRQHLGAGVRPRWVSLLNEGLLAATGAHARLLPLAYLPLEDPDAACAEYLRVRGEPRWAGVVGSAAGASVSLASPDLEPLWDLLAADRRMLLLHPGTSPDARLEEMYLANLLGNPVETAVAAAQLVLGGVLTRHPGMRVVLVHCGGCVPTVVGRWTRGVDTSRPGLVRQVEDPRAAVRRLWVDCLAHDAAVVDLAVTTFGEDKLVLGSDWPFPMGTDDPQSLVDHLPAALRIQVATGNAAAALGRTARTV